MKTTTLILSFYVLSISSTVLAQDSEKIPRQVDDSKHIGELYDRLAADIVRGRPIVVTVYVALCDNDSQGIIPTKNPRICMGDRPDLNLYWASGAGLWRHLTENGYNRIDYKTSQTDTIAAQGVWHKRFLANGELRRRGIKRFELYVIGLAYRGTEIHNAVVDFLASVRSDKALPIALPNGVQIEAGGRSHIVGYVGHDYLMDLFRPEDLYEKSPNDSTLHKGIFALACISSRYFRPAIQRRNTHILALNPGLTFPSAYTVRGILEAVAAGKGYKKICRHAIEQFAKGQKRPLEKMGRTIVCGDR